MTNRSAWAVPEGRIATVGGVLGPIALVCISFVTLRAASGDDSPTLVLVPPSLFFGLMAFDLAVAAGFALSRHWGKAARTPSTGAAFGIILLPIWLGVAAAAHHEGGWVASPLAVAAVGLACLAVQVTGVASLNGLGRHDRPT